MIKGNLYCSDYFVILLFPSLEILRKAKFTDLSGGGYRNIITPNGPSDLYPKLQTEYLSKELNATVTFFSQNEPFIFLENFIYNNEEFYHIIGKDRVGWFKKENWHRIIPLQ